MWENITDKVSRIARLKRGRREVFSVLLPCLPEVAVVVALVEHLKTPPPSDPAMNVVLSS